MSGDNGNVAIAPHPLHLYPHVVTPFLGFVTSATSVHRKGYVGRELHNFPAIAPAAPPTAAPPAVARFHHQLGSHKFGKSSQNSCTGTVTFCVPIGSRPSVGRLPA